MYAEENEVTMDVRRDRALTLRQPHDVLCLAVVQPPAMTISVKYQLSFPEGVTALFKIVVTPDHTGGVKMSVSVTMPLFCFYKNCFE